uniref:G-protein coupled receptors family 1 profile domain-containing protein n=1 Tax=Romanomermis culicivorax TaxID=13658 RepID=A0A915K8D8_ROMCU
MWSGASPNLSIDDTKLANLNTFSAVLLGIFTIAALILNFLLILAILCSYSLRNTVFYYHILHLAALNLLNACVSNVIKMTYVWSGEWVLGQFMCTFDAFLGELLMIQTLYMLTLLSVDRAIAMMSIY